MKTVLLIDDEPICHFLMSRVLKKIVPDLEIITAVNGQEAIKLLGNLINQALKVPSIIFLDINMPVMDGFEFLEAYNKIGIPKPSARIVLVSSSSNSKDKIRAQSYGITDFILKPIDEKSVLEMLHIK